MYYRNTCYSNLYYNNLGYRQVKNSLNLIHRLTKLHNNNSLDLIEKSIILFIIVTVFIFKGDHYAAIKHWITGIF